MIASPNEIMYFIELAKTLNFSRASTRIGISQPSLSVAIKRLEHAINAELFIRDKHRVILTQAGKNLLSHSNQLLQLWNMTRANCLVSQKEIQGSITLGCHPSVALSLLPKCVPNLMSSYPKLDIQLRHDLSRKITEEVINLTIDIGVVVNPIQHPDLIIKQLFKDKITCWRSNTIGSTAGEIIICDPELMQTQWLLKKLHKKGVKYKRLITSSNLEVAASLTASGVGIGILPTCVVMPLYQDKLQCVSNAPIYEDNICLVYRHENRNSKAIEVTIEAIKNCYNK